jgi:putative flippase GtrA
MLAGNAIVARFADSRLGRLAFQFFKFGLVGIVGLIVDVAAVWLIIRQGGVNFYLGRVFTYLLAATTTWALNRAFTFRGASRAAPVRQWLTFLLANAMGGIANYLTSASLVALTSFFHDYPEAATAMGSLAGMMFNFVASKRYVFRH